MLCYMEKGRRFISKVAIAALAISSVTVSEKHPSHGKDTPVQSFMASGVLPKNFELPFAKIVHTPKK